MADYLRQGGSNLGGGFASSDASEATVAAARSAVSDLMGADPAAVAFGQNMTSLTFALSRALARTWSKGDRVVVTQLDHDANVTPWVVAAEERGVAVDRALIRLEDGTLDYEHLESLLDRSHPAGGGDRGVQRIGHRGRRRPGGRGRPPSGGAGLRGRRPSHSPPPRTSEPSAPTCSSPRRTSSSDPTPACWSGGCKCSRSSMPTGSDRRRRLRLESGRRVPRASRASPG